MHLVRAGVYGRQSRGSKKSIADQMAAGQVACEEAGWEARAYSDQVSASWYGGKQRGGWAEVLADLEAGELDVLVLWESSRGDRRLTEWSRLLDTCQEHGVLIHVISHERTYNARNHRDWETLATDGVKSQAEVNLLSARVRRGVAAAAREGRPAAGPVPYGYLRVYDPKTGELLRQEADPEAAAVVTWIFEQVAASRPLGQIADELNARGVTPPGQRSNNRMTSAQWYRERVRKIAHSRTYLGERKHKDAWHPAPWPPLTDPETYYAAQRVLSEPARFTNTGRRPGKQKWLLTYLARCGKCDGYVRARARGSNGAPAYDCPNGCVHIKMAPVDELIGELVCARLADPEVYGALRSAGEADTSAAEAWAQVEELSGRLDELRLSAARGETSLASLAVIEPVLTQQIADARSAAEAAALPAALAGWLGGPSADVAARWAQAGVQARRSVLRALGLRVRLLPSGQNSYLPLHERVDVDWLGAVA